MAARERVVGVDFGTLSGRAVVVRAADGEELGTAVHEYAHGVIGAAAPARAPDWALQDPEDYLDVLRDAVPAAVRAAGIAPEQRGRHRDRLHGLDADAGAARRHAAVPREFPDRPHAFPKLWKHHAAQRQADRINALAAERGEPWLPRYGGLISSEWEFAKALQVLEEDPEVYDRDGALDRGRRLDRVAALRPRDPQRVHGGLQGDLPGRPLPVARSTWARSTSASPASRPPGSRASRSSALGACAGRLTAQAAGWTGLPEGIAVAAGNVDAHVTAPAARRRRAGPDADGDGHLHVPRHERRRAGRRCRACAASWTAGSCPGCGATRPARAASATSSAGSSTFAGRTPRGAQRGVAAAAVRSAQHGLIALDWNNGNRSVLVDHELSGLIVGLTLATRPEDVYRALVEATAFGTRTILETFERAGAARCASCSPPAG